MSNYATALLRIVMTLVLVASIISATPACAISSTTGAGLMEVCNKDERGALMCGAYVWGVANTIQMLIRAKTIPAQVCIPDDEEIKDVGPAVKGWLYAHPKDAELDAPAAILAALTDLYPCKGAKP